MLYKDEYETRYSHHYFNHFIVGAPLHDNFVKIVFLYPSHRDMLYVKIL